MLSRSGQFPPGAGRQVSDPTLSLTRRTYTTDNRYQLKREETDRQGAIP